MRHIPEEDIQGLVKNLIYQASFELDSEAQEALQEMLKLEKSTLAQEALRQINTNYELAKQEQIPLCQDTGTAIFWVQMGHEVQLDEPLKDTLERATGEAYQEFYLRKSILKDPLLERVNTGDNLPITLHLEQVAGNKLQIHFMAKGGGAENKSALKMLVPAAGEQGVIDFVVDTVRQAGGAACPPFVLGVGIGGTFDTVAGLAKKALWQPLSAHNQHSGYAQLEQKITQAVNELGLGAMAWGGTETVLATHIQTAPCHIASLPVAVNVQCHSWRVAKGEV